MKANGLSDKIKVISAKIEEINLPEMVDTIISEPIGYMLFNERMIETYLHAKKFLKPGGTCLHLPTYIYTQHISLRSAVHLHAVNLHVVHLHAVHEVHS